MRHAQPNQVTARPAININGDAHRHAYNAAFDALGLPWHWDAATYDRFSKQAQGGVQAYLETEQPHLLRAYEASFLVAAIESAKAARMAG